MTQTNTARWHAMRNDESRLVEKVLREGGFEQVDAYRYNPASIWVRVIDPRFEGLRHLQRRDWVEEHIQKLPESIRRDIIIVDVAPLGIRRRREVDAGVAAEPRVRRPVFVRVVTSIVWPQNALLDVSFGQVQM